jgi:hypothetical protein
MKIKTHDYELSLRKTHFYISYILFFSPKEYEKKYQHEEKKTFSINHC